MKLAPVALVLLFALAGCGGGTPPTGTPTEAAPSPTETGSNPVDTGDAVACTREDMSSEYEATDNTAGAMHGVLTLTNTSPAPCTMDGFPVLYMGSGEVEGPIGQPAALDDSTPAELITLQPGNVASSNVTITQAGNYEGCNLATTTHMIVAPPLDHPFEWELDGQHVDIPETPICYDDEIGLLSVTPLVLASS